MKELPDKLSDLLEVGLEDLEKCQKDDNYFIDMGEWHKPWPGGICAVCMAGSVMAKRLRTDSKYLVLYPASFDDDTANKLMAISHVSLGAIWAALKRLYPTTGRLEDSVNLTEEYGDAYFDPISYSRDPRMFKVDIQRIIKALRKYKL